MYSCVEMAKLSDYDDDDGGGIKVNSRKITDSGRR